MTQNYETVLLMDPSLKDEDVQEYLEQFSAKITDAGGEITRTQTWGKRRLQYPIFKRKEAFYFLICFKMQTGAGPVIEEFERQVRINDELLREMTVKVDKLRVMDPPTANLVLGRSGPRFARGSRPGGPRPGAPAHAAPTPAPAAADASAPATPDDAPAPTGESTPPAAEGEKPPADAPPAETPPADAPAEPTSAPAAEAKTETEPLAPETPAPAPEPEKPATESSE